VSAPARAGTRRVDLRWAWGAALVAIVALLAVGTLGGDEPTDAERAQKLATEIRCPQCKSQSVAQSETPSARGVKSVIADEIAAGRSDEEIRDRLAAAYGDDILLDPAGSGFSALVWAVPVVVVLVAVGGLVYRFRDWRPGGAAPSEADRDLVAAALGDPGPTPPEPERPGERDGDA